MGPLGKLMVHVSSLAVYTLNSSEAEQAPFVTAMSHMKGSTIEVPRKVGNTVLRNPQIRWSML